MARAWDRVWQGRHSFEAWRSQTITPLLHVFAFPSLMFVMTIVLSWCQDPDHFAFAELPSRTSSSYAPMINLRIYDDHHDALLRALVIAVPKVGLAFLTLNSGANQRWPSSALLTWESSIDAQWPQVAAWRPCPRKGRNIPRNRRLDSVSSQTAIIHDLFVEATTDTSKLLHSIFG